MTLRDRMIGAWELVCYIEPDGPDGPAPKPTTESFATYTEAHAAMQCHAQSWGGPRGAVIGSASGLL
jgi:hypothetical protein